MSEAALASWPDTISLAVFIATDHWRALVLAQAHLCAARAPSCPTDCEGARRHPRRSGRSRRRPQLEKARKLRARLNDPLEPRAARADFRPRARASAWRPVDSGAGGDQSRIDCARHCRRRRRRATQTCFFKRRARKQVASCVARARRRPRPNLDRRLSAIWRRVALSGPSPRSTTTPTPTTTTTTTTTGRPD